MKIEVLYPEFCNLYGELENIEYLKQSLKDIEIIQTELNDEPAFVKQEINLIYMGAMTESTQEKVIQKLLPYKSKIEELIQKDTVFLFTANAFEVLGQYIENEDGTRIEGLGIIPTYAKRQMMKRYGGLILGTIEDIKIVGFKDQFSHSYGDNTDKYFIKVQKGIGLNPESKLEGIRIHNFFGTYILGPILITNPHFTKYILKLMGQKEPIIAFEDIAIKAYNKRLEEFESNKIMVK